MPMQTPEHESDHRTWRRWLASGILAAVAVFAWLFALDIAVHHDLSPALGAVMLALAVTATCAALICGAAAWTSAAMAREREAMRAWMESTYWSAYGDGQRDREAAEGAQVRPLSPRRPTHPG